MIEIHLERPEERDAALAVEAAAFGESGDDEVAIIRAVRDDPASFALVATDDGEVVGHVQFSPAAIGETAVAALGPIGVRPQRQGEGIGVALVRGGLDEARRRGLAAVILLGDPNYYGRLGFEPARPLGLRNPFAGVTATGFAIREEDLQLVRLDGAVALAGEVRWHPVFG